MSALQHGLKNMNAHLSCFFLSALILLLSGLLPLLLFSLITHHSIEEWCLGDCALGEGMYPQSVTNGHFYQFGGRALEMKADHSFYLFFPPHLLSVLSVGEISHILNKCSHTVSDLSSIQPLINPAFPCGRSLEGDAGGQREASALLS